MPLANGEASTQIHLRLVGIGQQYIDSKIYKLAGSRWLAYATAV
jgi:hypothetical protein